jgi:phosphatidate cytidylyltransferase
MEQKLYMILWIYFSIGAVVIIAINRNKPSTERKQNWLKYFTYLFIINLLFASIYFNKSLFHYLSIAILLICLFEIFRNTYITGKLKTGIISLIVFLLLAFAFFSFSLMNREIVFYTFFMITVFDAFSQISGQLLGKRKLLPNISPNKTLEGLLGGYTVSIFTSFMIRDLLEITAIQSLLFGLGISTFAFAGDIFASFTKRKFGIKDFSNLIPGHGGFLDRFDSLIMGGSFMYLFIKYFAL